MRMSALSRPVQYRPGWSLNHSSRPTEGDQGIQAVKVSLFADDIHLYIVLRPHTNIIYQISYGTTWLYGFPTFNWYGGNNMYHSRKAYYDLFWASFIEAISVKWGDKHFFEIKVEVFFFKSFREKYRFFLNIILYQQESTAEFFSLMGWL